MGALVLAGASLLLVSSGGDERPQPPRVLPPFLDLFRASGEARVVGDSIELPGALGPVRGYLARPENDEVLPAVLVVPDGDGITDWVRREARALASIGYVVLAVDAPLGAGGGGVTAAWPAEAALAPLTSAARWLRRRGDVQPHQLGVIGWSSGAAQALALAAGTPLEACVVCDGPVTADPAILAALRGTPVLGVFAGNGDRAGIEAFRRALAARHAAHDIRVYNGMDPGFLWAADRGSPARDAAEAAWVVIFEFLGKYVEDAPPSAPAAAPTPVGNAESWATIADLMRSVNAPTGVRGALMRQLEQEPRDDTAWRGVRANAALLAEAARLLAARRPSKGSPSDWAEQTRGFAENAGAILRAADEHDYTAVRRAAGSLAARCAACHRTHR